MNHQGPIPTRSTTMNGDELVIPDGCGLGLRQGLMDELEHYQGAAIDFLEVAPENWIGVGGQIGRRFEGLLKRYPLVCHGLSLSLGSPAPLDMDFLRQVRHFLDQHRVCC